MNKVYYVLLFVLLSFVSGYCEIDSNNDIKYKNIYHIDISGIITNATDSYIKENMKKAEDNYSILLITLDTPGGVLESTRQIVQSILSSKIPVVVYVYPEGARAASAGIFITMAANYAVMSESSNLGAAHPVDAAGKDIKGDMAKKVLNDTTALIRTICEKRNRNIDKAVGMVTDSKSYTASEALKLKIIDNISKYEDIYPLIKNKYPLDNNAKIIKVERTLTQEIYKLIANPNFLSAILFLGIVLIGLEIKMAGSFIFGSLGALALIIFAIGANIIPINYLGIMLIILGFALIFAEFFITSFGLLTISAMISFIFGLRMLFDNENNMGVDVHLGLIFSIIVITILIVFLIGRLIIKDFKRKPASGIQTIINEVAQVIEWENKQGRVIIFEEIWNAISNESFNIGDKVIIKEIKGMKLIVEKYNDAL